MYMTLPTSMESSNATNSSFPAKLLLAVQAEMVAMETSIDVGNILWIFYDCLWGNFEIKVTELKFLVGTSPATITLFCKTKDIIDQLYTQKWRQIFGKSD